MEENVSDALKMAGSVLLFVLALSVCMLAFTNARESLDTILKFSDREYLTIREGALAKNYYYLSNSNISENEKYLSRTVGYETILPTLYRALDDGFMVVFKNNDDEYHTVYQMKTYWSSSTYDISVPVISSYNFENRYIKDNTSFGRGINKEELNRIITLKDGNGNPVNTFNNGLCAFDNDYSLIDFIKSGNFKEELGIVYLEDLKEFEYKDTDSDGDVEEEKYGEFSEYNKTPIRIITYTKV